MLRSSPPTGPLTPPMTPLRTPGAAGPAGLTPEALAALLGQQQAGMGGMPGMGGPSQGEFVLCWKVLCWRLVRVHCSRVALPAVQPPSAATACPAWCSASSLHLTQASTPSLPLPADALLGQLLGQLSGAPQQQPAPASMALPQHPGLAQQMAAMQQQMQGQQMQGQQMQSQQMGGGPTAPTGAEGSHDSAAIQALLAQAGLLAQGGGMVARPGAPSSAPGSAVGLPSPGAGSAARGPGSALSTGALSTGTASPTHSLSQPMPTPLFNGGGSLGGGQGPPSARGAGSYLGTSPTATHSSAGDTGEHQSALLLGVWL